GRFVRHRSDSSLCYNARMTDLLDGRPIAREIEDDLRERVAALARRDSLPALAVVLCGDDSPSRVYGRMIEKGCRRVGAAFRQIELPSGVSFTEAAATIE